MKITAASLIVSGCMATASLASAQTTAPSTQPDAPRPAPPADMQPMRVDRVDEGFMRQAAENGLAEVQASNVALRKATNAQVKSFAQQMVDDHGKSHAELVTLATKKGVKMPDGPSLMQKAKLKALEAADGVNFDQRYIASMGVQAHEDTLALFDKASREARDPEVKAFASKTVPTLQHHLEMARKIDGVVNAADARK